MAPDDRRSGGRPFTQLTGDSFGIAVAFIHSRAMDERPNRSDRERAGIRPEIDLFFIALERTKATATLKPQPVKL